MRASGKTTRERWKPVPGFERHYSVSSMGRVRRETPARGTQAGALVTPRPSNRGYLKVDVSSHGFRHTLLVHRIVAEAFLGPQPSPQHIVGHKNHDRTDNRLTNLCWCTYSENNRLAAARRAL